MESWIFSGEQDKFNAERCIKDAALTYFIDYRTILTKYFYLISKPIPLEQESECLEQILALAQVDDNLALLLDEVDELSYQERGFHTPDSFRECENQRAAVMEFIVKDIELSIIDHKTILLDYYTLMTRSSRSEREADYLERILELAQTDEKLALLLDEIDEIVYQEIGVEETSFALELQEEEAKIDIKALISEQMEKSIPGMQQEESVLADSPAVVPRSCSWSNPQLSSPECSVVDIPQIKKSRISLFFIGAAAFILAARYASRLEIPRFPTPVATIKLTDRTGTSEVQSPNQKSSDLPSSSRKSKHDSADDSSLDHTKQQQLSSALHQPMQSGQGKVNETRQDDLLEKGLLAPIQPQLLNPADVIQLLQTENKTPPPPSRPSSQIGQQEPTLEIVQASTTTIDLFENQAQTSVSNSGEEADSEVDCCQMSLIPMDNLQENLERLLDSRIAAMQTDPLLGTELMKPSQDSLYTQPDSEVYRSTSYSSHDDSVPETEDVFYFVGHHSSLLDVSVLNTFQTHEQVAEQTSVLAQ